MLSNGTCPCCGHKVSLKDRNTPYTGKSGRTISGVYTHSRCGAVLGSCYKGESYDIYLPYWAPADIPPENWRYFNLEVLGSKGIEYIHGWFDCETRRLTQVG